jgi:phosphoribosylformylglycinamidine synthase I
VSTEILNVPAVAPVHHGQPRAIVLRAPGTNCERETELALELAGASAERVHVERLLAEPGLLADSGILVLPGGFSFGDHLGAGALWSHHLEPLGEAIVRFVESGRPVLGICNGFQVLMRLGLLEGGALGPNHSGRFECRWVWLEKPANVTSPLLDGIERVAYPVANGEGRFVAESESALARLREAGQIALVYAGDSGPAEAYPANPNGSDGAVAALVNRAGNVLGIMPHPERNVLPGQAPAGREDGAGLAIFRNAVALARR